VYDRERVLALPPLPTLGDALTYSDLLRAYYPAGNADQAVKLNDFIETLIFRDAEEPTLKRLADFLGVPAHRLQRIFSTGGLTLRSVVERVRIQHAEGLLADTDRTVVDVAVAVGYSSAQALTKGFKKLRGLSPSEYRHYVHLHEYDAPASAVLVEAG